MNSTNIKNWFLALGIGIIFVLFINFGVQTFSPEPQYEDFCDSRPRPIREPFLIENDCDALNVPAGFQDECFASGGFVQTEYGTDGCPVTYSCDTCNQSFQDARSDYRQNIFFILVILGILALVSGMIITEVAVSSGFLLGGILTVIVATLRTWSDIGDILRFLLLGLVLALLVFIGLIKNPLQRNHAKKPLLRKKQRR